MNTYKIQKVKISDIESKLDNPRFDLADNQRDVIEKMISDQQTSEGGSKLLNLAKNIVENGINPSERILLAIHEAEPNKYVVLEGNRRIICLKILETPEIIEQTHPKLYKKFKALSVDFNKSPIHEIECVIFENADDSKKWIELKHTGQNEGVGIVEWNPQQQGRFKGDATLALQAIELLRNSPNIDSTLKNDLGKVPSSSLKRLLDDPDFRNGVGLKKEGDKLASDLEQSEVEKVLTKIVKDLLAPSFNVKEIYYKDDRKDYLDTFKSSDLPDTTKKATSWTFDKPPVSTSTAGAITTRATANTIRPVPPSTDRKTLIPSTFKIKITETKPNTIYHELRKLNIDDFPNSGSVMFRVFLELSVDAYMDKNSVPYHSNDALKERIKKLANYFESNNIMTHNELFGIRALAAATDGLFSVTSFNKYVHNYHFQPIIKDLKTLWDNIQLFLQKIWETY